MEDLGCHPAHTLELGFLLGRPAATARLPVFPPPLLGECPLRRCPSPQSLPRPLELSPGILQHPEGSPSWPCSSQSKSTEFTLQALGALGRQRQGMESGCHACASRAQAPGASTLSLPGSRGILQTCPQIQL